MKSCLHCGETKPVEAFYRDSAAADGRRPECKSCTAEKRKARYQANREREIARVKRWQQANPERVRAAQRRVKSDPGYKRRERDAYLRRKYGISIDEYEATLAAQGGVCAICKRGPTQNISLHVDHDHASGRARGLLCFRCNNALGDFADDYERLEAASAYLEAHDPEVQELIALAKQRVAALKA
ncbi:MAG TPA: endonuclease VII domain-containing protein [Acidimicrobiales bacterium]|jgi:hypothetical protein|nr:endonuclease VII domain-containing protein [Acidimicrobiales bacterium]